MEPKIGLTVVEDNDFYHVQARNPAGCVAKILL
jgi:hypothetical protein